MPLHSFIYLFVEPARRRPSAKAVALIYKPPPRVFQRPEAPEQRGREREGTLLVGRKSRPRRL